MDTHYDVIIIGGGPGGYNCAIRCGQLGLKTACVEMRKTLGGTCLNVGCIPSKALLHASELYEMANRDFAAMGIDVGTPKLNLKKMMAQKDNAVNGLTKGVDFLLKKNKVDHVAGRGRIDGIGRVIVERDDNQQTELTGKNIVIATGSQIASLPGIEIDGTHIISSDHAIALDSVPEKLVLIGAGVIGLELGSVWRRLGAEVTVFEYMDRILPTMDSEISKVAKRIFTKQGLKFKLSRKVSHVDKQDTGVHVLTEAASGGKPESFDADIVLVSVGRQAYTAGLGLETIGIETDQRGFIRNSAGKSDVDGVWVIGDVTTGPMLAHKAEDEGVMVAERIAGKSGHVNYNTIPNVVYTDPEIASVGQTEESLKAQNRAFKIGKFPFQANSRGRTNHQTDGLVKILADADTDEILGGHIIGKSGGEMIAELALAMEFHAASEDIARTCHAHPTLSEAVRQAAMAVEGWAMQT